MREYDENISGVSNEIIGTVDNMFEEEPLPHRIHEMDPSIEELCDAVEYLINSGWLGSTIFAWKMTYTESRDDDIEKTGITVSNKEDYYTKYTMFYKPIKGLPLVIGLMHNRFLLTEYDKKFPKETVILKLEDGTLITRKEYEKLQNENQKQKLTLKQK